MNTHPNNNREAGLYDEQVFKVLVEYELSRAQRYPSPLTMLHISLNLVIYSLKAPKASEKCLAIS